MRRLVLLAWLLAVGCAPPDYVPVGLQVDLEVSEADDPFERIAGLRVCLTSDEGDGFFLFPRDPGTYLIPDVPAGAMVSLEIQGIDREPDEIDLGDQPSVRGRGGSTGGGVAGSGEGAAHAVEFASCADDECPEDCSMPETLPVGESSIGLRRAPGDA